MGLTSISKRQQTRRRIQTNSQSSFPMSLPACSVYFHMVAWETSHAPEQPAAFSCETVASSKYSFIYSLSPSLSHFVESTLDMIPVGHNSPEGSCSSLSCKSGHTSGVREVDHPAAMSETRAIRAVALTQLLLNACSYRIEHQHYINIPSSIISHIVNT